MAPKKTGKKAPKPEVTLEQLIAVAEDFNAFMFSDPNEGIMLDLEYEDLLAEVTDSAEELEATDTIQFETAETLNALGLETVAGIADFEEPRDEEGPRDKDKTEEQKENDDPADGEVDAEDGMTIKARAADIALLGKTKDVNKMKNVAKAWGVRIPPPFYKDINKLREYLIGKIDGTGDTATAPEKKEKAVKTAGDKYTRSNALIDSLKKFSGNTREEIVNQADALFVEKGGNTNTNVSNYMFGYVMPSLIILGIVSKTDDKYIWNK